MLTLTAITQEEHVLGTLMTTGDDIVSIAKEYVHDLGYEVSDVKMVKDDVYNVYVKEMTKMTIKEVAKTITSKKDAIAFMKELGITGYSKLNKADTLSYMMNKVELIAQQQAEMTHERTEQKAEPVHEEKLSDCTAHEYTQELSDEVEYSSAHTMNAVQEQLTVFIVDTQLVFTDVLGNTIELNIDTTQVQKQLNAIKKQLNRLRAQVKQQTKIQPSTQQQNKDCKAVHTQPQGREHHCSCGHKLSAKELEYVKANQDFIKAKNPQYAGVALCYHCQQAVYAGNRPFTVEERKNKLHKHVKKYDLNASKA